MPCRARGPRQPPTPWWGMIAGSVLRLGDSRSRRAQMRSMYCTPAPPAPAKGGAEPQVGVALPHGVIDEGAGGSEPVGGPTTPSSTEIDDGVSCGGDDRGLWCRLVSEPDVGAAPMAPSPSETSMAANGQAALRNDGRDRENPARLARVHPSLYFSA